MYELVIIDGATRSDGNRTATSQLPSETPRNGSPTINPTANPTPGPNPSQHDTPDQASYFDGSAYRHSISTGGRFRSSDIVADALPTLPGAPLINSTLTSTNAGPAPKFLARSMTERGLNPLAQQLQPSVQALGVDPEQDFQRLPAHLATSAGGTPPLSQVETAACRRSYGRFASGVAAISSVLGKHGLSCSLPDPHNRGLGQLRAATGETFALYDGRCRHVVGSVQAGATGVIAVPLDLPTREDSVALQSVIDRTQALIDARPTLPKRLDMLTALLTSRAAT